MILELGRDEQCGEHRITLYPVGRESPDPNPSCTGEGKAQQRREPSTSNGIVEPWVGTVTRLSWLTSAAWLAANQTAGLPSTAPVGTNPVSR